VAFSINSSQTDERLSIGQTLFIAAVIPPGTAALYLARRLDREPAARHHG